MTRRKRLIYFALNASTVAYNTKRNGWETALRIPQCFFAAVFCAPCHFNSVTTEDKVEHPPLFLFILRPTGCEVAIGILAACAVVL